ncbi:MAG: hypothetical protein U9N40_07420 [Euryarchaeota archaeon]|nr:hypothetical protein [Euryarchaeota archaeon]
MRKIAILVVLLFAVLTLSAGCTGGSGDATAAPAATPTSTATPAETTVSLTPGPTQVPPSNLAVDYTVAQDPITAEITVTFAGGMGQSLLDTAQAEVMYSDGRVVKKEIGDRTGSEAVFEGSRDAVNRVVVTVFFDNGATYRVVDTLVDFSATKSFK